MAAYSSVPVRCFFWGSPSCNDLFHHSNDTLDQDTGSSSTYDPLLCTQSIAQGKLSSPQGVFVHILHKKDSQHPCGHRSHLKTLPSSAIVQPSLSHLTVDEAVISKSFFFPYCSNTPFFPFFREWLFATEIVPISLFAYTLMSPLAFSNTSL